MDIPKMLGISRNRGMFCKFRSCLIVTDLRGDVEQPFVAGLCPTRLAQFRCTPA
jgi:hypothetical protein